jgi:hypothetical protein
MATQKASTKPAMMTAHHLTNQDSKPSMSVTEAQKRTQAGQQHS